MEKIRAMCGIVPPPLNFTQKQYEDYLNYYKDLLDRLNPDIISIYSIQEEKGRNGCARPFPFSPHCNVADFANELQRKNLILYCTNEDEYHENKRQNDHLVMVGQKQILLIENKNESKKIFGGVLIPSRDKEVQRIVERQQKYGLQFFTTQILFETRKVCQFLKAYSDECRVLGILPCTLFISFAPFLQRKTKEFLEWLGVEIPEHFATQILEEKNIEERKNKILLFCYNLFSEIVYFCDTNNLNVPLGANVECISRSNHERCLSEEMFTIISEKAKIKN